MIHETENTVRFYETDGLGHVSNISFYIYLEEARIDFLRKLGVSMDIADWSYIVASTACDYKQQAYFDETLITKTQVNKIGNSSFELIHRIENDRGLIALGKAVMVHFDFKSQQSIRIPEDVRKKLQEYIYEG
ncbi:acyl-CoA thioesterase [Aquibacillus albus]|uniref:Acyl-CoA thioester hydrolase n=1 Tax=Aquibacillus albus TaxID=1168171 RepID=A0ABS2MY91_9BACI|nr:thioesterase family protein [Aquibacillus albus]MBM7570851.1 acyl-CoA thioester hydrolase [Aquibacillus albus]